MSDPRTLAIAVLLLILLAVLARLFRAATHPRPRPPLRTAAVGVAAVGAAWMLANGEVEGEILFVLTRGHGMTEADIPSVVLFVVAAVLVVRSWLPPRPPDRPRGDPPTLPAPAASPEQQGGPLSRRPSRRRAS